MYEKIERVFNQLESEKETLLSSVAHLDEVLFNKSVNNKWSVSQILTHILTSEKLALQYMQKKSQAISTLRNSGFMETMKLSILKASQRLPIKYKAPTVILEKTPAGLSFSELTIEWNHERDKMRQFLSSIDDKDIKKLIFKHPILGKFNVSQGLVFMLEHFKHHLPQIKRHLKY